MKPGAPNEPPRAEPQRGATAPVAPVAASPMVKPAAQKPAEKRAQGGTELDELKAQLAQMQAKLEKLAEPDK
jgi:hypothetical protein